MQRVYICDVAGIDNMTLAKGLTQYPEKQIKHDCRACIADMSIIIDRGPANIERNPLRIGWLEYALFAAHGVVDLQGHVGVLFDFTRFASRLCLRAQ